MSWRPEMLVRESGGEKWYPNAVRFATKEEAEAYAADLFARWTVPIDKRAVESEDPVNYRWVDGRLQPLETAAAE